MANADISLIWVWGCENDDFLGGSCVSRERRVVSIGLCPLDMEATSLI